MINYQEGSKEDKHQHKITSTKVRKWRKIFLGNGKYFTGLEFRELKPDTKASYLSEHQLTKGSPLDGQ